MIASTLASTASNALGQAASSALTGSGAANGAFNQTDFMKLLVAQMQYQNPLEPASGTDMMSQLAQFSSVQGIQQLNTSFTNLLTLQQLTQGANLIGKTVVYDKSGSSIPGRGVVQAVKMQNGTLQLAVGTDLIDLTQVRGMMAST